MAGFLDKFRGNVVASVWKDKKDVPKAIDIDDKIALGDKSDWHGSLKVPPFYFRSINVAGNS